MVTLLPLAACSVPWLIGLTSRTARALRAPPATATSSIRNSRLASSHRPSIQHGRTTALASSLVALPASLGLLRPVSATGGGLRAPLAFGGAVFRRCGRPLGVSSHLQPLRGLRLRIARRCRLQSSFAHWAYYGLFRALRAAFVRPHQFPLKSCGFSSAETARKRFLLWKMKFSATKIAPSPPYTPPGTIEARKGFTPLLGYSQSAPLYMSRALRALTKYRKNEALIRNDGVYVISGIFCRANACVCGKNAFPPRSLAANL